MITIANGFMILGALAGVAGILGGVLLVVTRLCKKWPRWRWPFFNDRFEIGVDLGTWLIGFFVMNWCVVINVGPLDLTLKFRGRAIQ